MTDVTAAVDYAEQLHQAYMGHFAEIGVNLQSKQYLELGPGRNLGPQLLMVDAGADVTIADPFFPQWDDTYHPAVYRGINQRLGPSASIERVLEQRNYDGVIKLLREPAASLASVPSEHFDIITSNAVLEHVQDLDKAIVELKRVSKPGAIHSHQVDFRNHRDFDLPLEHLLWSRSYYLKKSKKFNFVFGCQTRPIEMEDMFCSAGFKLDKVTTDMFAEEAYLDDFMRRLRWRVSSPYQRWPRRLLRQFSVRYVMRA